MEAKSPRLTGASDDTYDRLAYLTLGYKNAGDRLTDAMAGGETIDGLMIYPAIFCYRQYLEREMMFILDYHSRSAGGTTNWKSHRLDVLWDELAPVLTKHRLLRSISTSPLETLRSNVGGAARGSLRLTSPHSEC